MKDFVMRKQYDFSNSKPNPYTSKLKKQITIRLDEDTVDYFKKMSEDKGIPYHPEVIGWFKEVISELSIKDRLPQ